MRDSSHGPIIPRSPIVRDAFDVPVGCCRGGSDGSGKRERLAATAPQFGGHPAKVALFADHDVQQGSDRRQDPGATAPITGEGSRCRVESWSFAVADPAPADDPATAPSLPGRHVLAELLGCGFGRRILLQPHHGRDDLVAAGRASAAGREQQLLVALAASGGFADFESFGRSHTRPIRALERKHERKEKEKVWGRIC